MLFWTTAVALAQQIDLPPLKPSPSPPKDLTVSEDLANQMPDPTLGLIRVDVTLTDNAGKSVSGLSQKDFVLLDNNQQQKVVTFQAFDDTSVRRATSVQTVLVIDDLNMLSNDRHLTAAAREAQTFLRANGGALQTPTIIYRLTADGLFVTPHDSLDGNELAAEIEKPGRLERIWSTPSITKDKEYALIGRVVGARVSQSLVALGSIAIEGRRKPGRKLVFWIGNGWQIESPQTAGLSSFSIELLTRMREARVNLWGTTMWPSYDESGNPLTVADYKGFFTGPKPDSTDLRYLSLPVIAARSGGGMLNTTRSLAALIGEQVKLGSSYYSLTFDPPRTNAIDEYHHLEVEIDKPSLTSHVFEDYYDEPVFYDQSPLTHWVTVKMLEDQIARPGVDLAQQIGGMELTERLSTAKLADLENQVTGKNAREALEVLADESAFLAPPHEEISLIPPPDITAQRQIISRTISYINTAVPRLPDFLATRTTVQYYEHVPTSDQTWKTASGDQSLYEGKIDEVSIRIRNGKEEVKQKSPKNSWEKPETHYVNTIGTFGPILSTVMVAATSPHSQLTWSRWEKGADGALAVFRYRSPQESFGFSTQFCCLAIDGGSVPFRKHSPFHGEIAIDPASGAILRLSIQADLEWRLPLERSDVMVEYAPVRRGERTFICPTRSVSISRQRTTAIINEWGESFKIDAPFETLLNEVRFDKYHVFGSTSRILPGFTEVPQTQ